MEHLERVTTREAMRLATALLAGWTLAMVVVLVWLAYGQ